MQPQVLEAVPFEGVKLTPFQERMAHDTDTQVRGFECQTTGGRANFELVAHSITHPPTRSRTRARLQVILRPLAISDGDNNRKRRVSERLQAFTKTASASKAVPTGVKVRDRTSELAPGIRLPRSNPTPPHRLQTTCVAQQHAH